MCGCEEAGCAYDGCGQPSEIDSDLCYDCQDGEHL